MNRSPKGPAAAIGTAADRVEILIKGVERVSLQPGGVGAGSRSELGHHRHAAIHGRLDQDPGANHARAIEPTTDPLQRLLVGDELLEPEAAIAAAGSRDDQNPNSADI